MAQMSDEERLVEILADSTHPNGSKSSFIRQNARETIAELRSRGVTITPPPAPEPTYTITMTRTEQKMVMRAIQFTQSNNARLDHGECDGYLELWERVQMLEPDPVPKP